MLGHLVKCYVHSKGHYFDQTFILTIKMYIFMKSRPCSKLVHFGQNFRSLCQIIENHIVHIRSIFFTPKLIALWSSSRVLKFYIKVLC